MATDTKLTRLLVIEQGSELSDLLSSEANLQLFTETAAAEEIASLVERLSARAVLLDLDVTGETEGIEAALELRRLQPEVAVVMVSGNPSLRTMRVLPTSDEYGFRTSWSYLLRRPSMDRDLLIRALHISLIGWTLLDAGVMARLHPRSPEALRSFTPRVRGMLQLADEGFTNWEIRERLFINMSNVEFTFYKVFQRLAEFAESEQTANT